MSGLLTVVVSVAVTLCAGSLLFARPAKAATLDELQARVDEAMETYNAATDKVNELQAQIDDSQAKIDGLENKLPEQREKARVAMSSLYKMQQGSPDVVSLALSPTSFMDLLSTLHYVNLIQQDNADQVQQLLDLKDELVDAQQSLVSAKAQATEQQEEAEEALSQAQASLDELNRQLAEQAAAQAAAAAAAQEAAQAAAAANQSNPAATDGSEVEPDGLWMIGKASAYDRRAGQWTASGEELTDDSVTVAVPASQRDLLGRSVQIRYGGMTITARVTDTGGFAKYGRALDFAPGVWKAFGASSSEDWGVRSVQYRFL